jgi:hypothetical protein
MFVSAQTVNHRRGINYPSIHDRKEHRMTNKAVMSDQDIHGLSPADRHALAEIIIEQDSITYDQVVSSDCPMAGKI